MRVLVFGADGRTGNLVVAKALAAGHIVTAFVHKTKSDDSRVRIVTGDAGDAEAVRGAMAGQDVVIDTIGGRTPYKHTELETSSARNVINGMSSEGVKRLIVVSALGVSDSIEQTPFWYEHFLIPTFLRGSTRDKSLMEEEVRSSGIDFVIVRPPMLTDGAETGSIQVVSGQNKAYSVTRGDLARFLIEQIDTDQYVGQSVVIANS